MSTVSAAEVKALRELTGGGFLDCRNALEEVGGDVDRAVELLRDRGIARAHKKSDRVANQGLVEPYIHGNGRIGALVELNCETDFVARNEQFRTLAHDIAMQVAATNPPAVAAEHDTSDLAEEELPLLDQPFIKDPKRTVGDLIKEHISALGENIVVRRFVRYELGGADTSELQS